MTPDFRIVVDQQDVTDVIRDRFISMRVTDEAGFQSDQIELVLDDRGHVFEWPEHGAEIECSLGYQETGLSNIGVFVVDEVGHSGPSSTLRIHAKAADMRGQMKEHKIRSWDNVTIETIVQTIAGEYDLTPRVSPALASILLQHIDQSDESDLHFLTRIAKDFDGIVKPTNGFLLFVTKGEARSVSGQLIPPIELSKRDVIRYQMTHADRGKYKSVKAFFQDTDEAERVPVVEGEDSPTYTIRQPFPTVEEASRKARAKLDALTRGTATLSLTLIGNPLVRAEGKIAVSGFRPPVNGDWIATRAEHSLNEQGLTTRVDTEAPKA